MVAATHWARFKARDGRVGFGILSADRLIEHAGDMYDAPRPTGVTLEPGSFALLSPCVPSKIVALWNNFHALAAKLGKAAPTHPLFLLKPASCLLGPEQPIRRPPRYAGKIAYEGELGIVIGARCSAVSADEASRHVFGYTCVNDVTAGELLNENPDFPQWCRAKGYDTFGCLGPTIATRLDWRAERVLTRVDGVERQNYPLADMILGVAELVSQVSHDMTLLPGDVIACGTSVGVGSMRDGATVEVEIAGIGTLRNTLG